MKYKKSLSVINQKGRFNNKRQISLLNKRMRHHNLRTFSKMRRNIFLLFCAAVSLCACSWSTQQIGQNDYEISGYFDFTMKGEVVVQGLKDQAALYCKGIKEGLVPQVYYVTDKNRIFDYQAQRASAVIRFHCVEGGQAQK